MANRVAADLLAEELSELSARDRLEVGDAQQDEALSLRERLDRSSDDPASGPDCVAEYLAGAMQPAAGDGNELKGPTAQPIADIVDDQIDAACGCGSAAQRRVVEDRIAVT